MIGYSGVKPGDRRTLDQWACGFNIPRDQVIGYVFGNTPYGPLRLELVPDGTQPSRRVFGGMLSGFSL